MIARRELLALFGTAAAWPLAARAQQMANLPAVGFLGAGSPATADVWLSAFMSRLRELGWIEGRNINVDVRWAEGRNDRSAEIAAEFVRLKVDVIVTYSSEHTQIAKQATSTIPIVFALAADPVGSGLVANLARPGGNVTGVGLLGSELETKRLELLHQLVPGTTPIGVLVNPTNPAADLQLRELQGAAGVIKRQIDIVRASTAFDIETAFEIAAQKGAGALLVVQDPFYNSRREQLVALAAHHKQPVFYPLREFAEIGGLVSYGHNLVDEYRQMGVYDINLKTAKTLGLTIPQSLLSTADEVIE